MDENATIPLGHLGEARSLVNEEQALAMRVLLTSDPTAAAELGKAVAAEDATIEKRMAEVKQTINTAAEKKDFAQYVQAWAAFKTTRDAILADYASTNDAEAAYELWVEKAVPDVVTLNETFESMFADTENLAAALVQDISDTRASSETISIGVIVGAIVIAILCALLITRSIKRGLAPVNDRLAMLAKHCAADLQQGLERISNGDLTFPVTLVTPLIDDPAGDEIGDEARSVNIIRNATVASVEAYNLMRANLTATISEIAASSNSVATSSQEMASTSEESGRAVGEIANAVLDVAEGAERQVQMLSAARATADSARETASSGSETAARMAAAMGDLDSRRVPGYGRVDSTLIVEIQAASGEAVRVVNEEAIGAFEQIAEQITSVHSALSEISSVSEETSAATEQGLGVHPGDERVDRAGRRQRPAVRRHRRDPVAPRRAVPDQLAAPTSHWWGARPSRPPPNDHRSIVRCQPCQTGRSSMTVTRCIRRCAGA